VYAPLQISAESAFGFLAPGVRSASLSKSHSRQSRVNRRAAKPPRTSGSTVAIARQFVWIIAFISSFARRSLSSFPSDPPLPSDARVNA
jgi:hypothetical protein